MFQNGRRLGFAPDPVGVYSALHANPLDRFREKTPRTKRRKRKDKKRERRKERGKRRDEERVKGKGRVLAIAPLT